MNTVMQSMLRQAGTSPRVLQRPLLGLEADKMVERPPEPAPDPAVSVPGARKRPSPAATATPPSRSWSRR